MVKYLFTFYYLLDYDEQNQINICTVSEITE